MLQSVGRMRSCEQTFMKKFTEINIGLKGSVELTAEFTSLKDMFLVNCEKMVSSNIHTTMRFDFL